MFGDIGQQFVGDEAEDHRLRQRQPAFVDLQMERDRAQVEPALSHIVAQIAEKRADLDRFALGFLDPQPLIDPAQHHDARCHAVERGDGFGSGGALAHQRGARHQHREVVGQPMRQFAQQRGGAFLRVMRGGEIGGECVALAVAPPDIPGGDQPERDRRDQPQRIVRIGHRKAVAGQHEGEFERADRDAGQRRPRSR